MMQRFFSAVTAATVAVLLLASATAVADKQLVPYSYASTARSHLFSRASYCLTSSVMTWSCGSICKRAPGFYTYKIVQNEVFDAFGFTGVDSLNKQIIVSFRGSQTLMNWLQDFSFAPVPYNTASSCGSACRVHMGFYNSYLSVQAQVHNAVVELLADFPDYQVLVTGHSLGGAMAVHAAVDLQEKFNRMSTSTKPVALTTFGSPRVGNPTFAAWTAQILSRGPHYRVTHGRDPVPHLPPLSFGFRHAPTEVFYRSLANSNGVVCDDSATREEHKCSNNYLPIMMTDHLFYMGEGALCLADTINQVTLPWRLYVRLLWEFTKNFFGF